MKTRSATRRDRVYEVGSSFVILLSGVQIPKDVFIRVLEFMPRRQAVHTASLVCKTWLAATREPSFWKSLDHAHGLIEQSLSIMSITKLLELVSRRQFAALKSLTPPCAVPLTSKSLKLIAKACPLLEEIDIGFAIYCNMLHITDADFLSLPSLFPHLAGIRFSLRSRLTLAGIANFCQSMGTRLATLRISDFAPYRVYSESYDELLVTVAQCCPNLIQFEYGSIFDPTFDPRESLFSEKGVIALLKGCTGMKILNLLSRANTGLAIFEYIIGDNPIELERMYIVHHPELYANKMLRTRLAEKVKHFNVATVNEHGSRLNSLSMYRSNFPMPTLFW